jgi:non-canonical purine NTP pyrophosphatase (RdgB/HAM1 family)
MLSPLAILYATGNRGKLREVRSVITGCSITLIEPAEVCTTEPAPSVVESGATYEENATLKARAFSRWSGCPTISDDSGIEFPALSGYPGVYTARVGVGRICGALSAANEHPARFVCVATFCDVAGRVVAVRSELEGTFRKKACEGTSLADLPFSSHFYPSGKGISLAELLNERSFLSHRGLALTRLLKVLDMLDELRVPGNLCQEVDPEAPEL